MPEITAKEIHVARDNEGLWRSPAGEYMGNSGPWFEVYNKRNQPLRIIKAETAEQAIAECKKYYMENGLDVTI